MTVHPRRIYLDHNASAPLLPEARAALVDALAFVGNPSSVHGEGRRARSIVEVSRAHVAALVGGKNEAVIFTSGATEAASTCLVPEWTIDGAVVEPSRLAVADTDHPATREGGRFAMDQVTRLPVDACGLLRIDALEAWIGAQDAGWSMLALTLANSETGVLQPLGPVLERIAGRRVIFVLDAVQAAGRMPLDIAALGADALLLSGHKIGATIGVGAIVLGNENRSPARLLSGGGQERRRRAGTEPAAAIASFGAAARIAARRAGEGAALLLGLRERLIAAIATGAADVAILGAGAERLSNTVAIAAPGLKAETAQMALDLDGFSVSSGSACSSGKVGPSHVLEAMRDGGLDVDPMAGAIRVSFGYETSEADIDLFAAAFRCVLEKRRQGEGGRKAA